MPDPFLRLKNRVSLLGNHHLKYIRSIENQKDLLIEGLESQGKIDQVHLWKSAPDPSTEMKVIAELGKSIDEKASLLGCYYSMQFLHMNLRLTDVLHLNLTSTRQRQEVYRDFMIQSGLSFRALTAGYMRQVLDLSVPESSRPEFVICGVGSRSDQDDIDVGIIDEGPENRDEFNKAVGRLRNEMLKHSSCLHLYLSEHVGTRAYSASIYEYRQLLDREIHDFIIITEMLGAAYILGSQRLFDQFKREITWRYHYAPHQDNKYHEAYLRGILGEVRSLLIRQLDPETLHIKDDGLRMLKSMIYVQKTIFRVDRVNAWEILDVLRVKDPTHTEIYDNMEKSLTFLEIFRHLYQLFTVQEEEIYLNDAAAAQNLAPVARLLGYQGAMGYQDDGAVRAWEHLLIHYRESVELARVVVDALMEEATEHLKSITVFASLPHYRSSTRRIPRQSSNLAVDFIRTSRFFRGTKFWDDVLETLQVDDAKLLHRFVADMESLKPRTRSWLIKQYGGTGIYTFYTLISFLVLLAKHRRKKPYQRLFVELNKAFLEAAWVADGRITKLSKLFSQYPKLINTYLLAASDPNIKRFQALLDGTVWEPEVDRFAKKLRELCHLHYSRSSYFKGFFIRVVQKYPEYIQYLDDTDNLGRIAKGLLARVDSLPTFAERKRALGDYYDLEFLRVGLNTLQSTPIETTNVQFTEFSDTYLQTLSDICKDAVDDQLERKVETRDLLAVFVAGGHAREQAYDDDYDMFIVLNSSDEEMRAYCNSIITRMNGDIVKRGTLPHYRFADHFGHYVTLVDEMDELFSEDRPDSFIDKSQILGSRMVIGSTKFGKEFVERIIRPHIFDKSKEYIEQMMGEIACRHRETTDCDTGVINVKECRGGLRDIEMILLIYKAKHCLREPINRKLMETLGEIEPHRKKDFEILGDDFDFLKSLRDVYRLTVSADDVLQTEYLEEAAMILGFDGSESTTASERLIAAYKTCAGRVADIIEEMLQEFR